MLPTFVERVLLDSFGASNKTARYSCIVYKK